MPVTEPNLDFVDNPAPGGVQWAVLDNPGLQAAELYGSVNLPNPPNIGALVGSGSCVCVPNNGSVVGSYNLGGGLEYDNGGLFSVAHPSRLTVPITARYLVNGFFVLQQPPTPAEVFIYWLLNGVNLVQFWGMSTKSGTLFPPTPNASMPIPLNAGDYVEMGAQFIYDSVAGAPNLNVSAARFSVNYLGPR